MPRAKFVAKVIRTAIQAAAVAVCICLLSACGVANVKPPAPAPISNLIKDIYADYFSVGAAVQSAALDKFTDLLPHFNSITAETEMKWSRLENKQGAFTYKGADAIVDWAKENQTAVRGHCLVWYKSMPAWVLADGTTKKQALDRMDAHIETTMRHFGNDVYCWDVVNEVLRDTVTADNVAQGEIWRTGGMADADMGDWYALCQTDYIKQAFKTADNARKIYGLDGVKLYYNDYSLHDPNKRKACIELIKMLRGEGIAIDGIGMQAHYKLPSYLADPQKFKRDFEASVKEFTGLGLDVQLTELDVRVYAKSNDPQIFDALPLDVEEQQAQMYGDIFEVCRRYAKPWQEGAGCVTNVTTWGIADNRNAWNTDEHQEYPLLFGTDGQAKKAYYEIISF